MRFDPRETVLAELNRAREERMDCDPTDRGRYDTLTAKIDVLLERLQTMSRP